MTITRDPKEDPIMTITHDPNEEPNKTPVPSQEEDWREKAEQAVPGVPSPESGDAHDDENPSG